MATCVTGTKGHGGTGSGGPRSALHERLLLRLENERALKSEAVGSDYASFPHQLGRPEIQ